MDGIEISRKITNNNQSHISEAKDKRTCHRFLPNKPRDPYDLLLNYPCSAGLYLVASSPCIYMPAKARLLCFSQFLILSSTPMAYKKICSYTHSHRFHWLYGTILSIYVRMSKKWLSKKFQFPVSTAPRKIKPRSFLSWFVFLL